MDDMTASTVWELIAFLCLILCVLILQWRMRTIDKVVAIMEYLTYEDLRLRAYGSRDEDVITAYNFQPMEEYPKDKCLMWLKSKEGTVTLAYTDGTVTWCADTLIGDIDGFAVINHGDDKVRIDVDFVEEDDEDDNDGGIGPEIMA